MSTPSAVSRLAGRVPEVTLLTEILREARAGRPGVVLVHGEAGIGKTRFVTEICADAANEGYEVLWGRCVHFGATSSPYLPLSTAFQDWLSDAAAVADRTRLVQEAGIAELVGALRGADAGSGGRLSQQIESALTMIAAHKPTVLVVDDIHWADETSLDVLGYLLTGLRRQRLVLVMTYRDDELAEGHRLNGWVGDVRRLPQVREQQLGRLDREETEEQVSLQLGRRSSMELVDAVLERSCGNPYLTELILREVDADAKTLPDGLPVALRSALLAKWHRLTAGARSVSQLLSVSGRPMTFEPLQSVASHVGLAGGLPEAVRECYQAGVVQAEANGSLWFHHPLLAEVLYGTLLPHERAGLHGAFVAVLQEHDPDDSQIFADLALHLEQAGDLDNALDYSLLAAHHAFTVQAFPEEAALRQRAARLWPRVSAETQKAHGPEARLLIDAAVAANRVGWDEAAWAASERAREVMDPETNPVLSARVLRLWSKHGIQAGKLREQPIATDREAVRLSATGPDLAEHAMCMAALAESLAWSGRMVEAATHAREAVRLADQWGSSIALALAFAARSTAHWREASAIEDADEAVRLAAETSDPEVIGHACIVRCNALEAQYRFPEMADEYVRGFERAARHGLGRQQQRLAASAAFALMDVARYDEARSMLREALATRTGGMRGIQTRLIGLRLAVCTGDLDQAAHHVDRILELDPELAGVIEFWGGAVGLGQFYIVTGRPDTALDLLRRTIEHHDPDTHEWTLFWSTAAAADLVRRGRDLRDEAAVERARTTLEQIQDIATSTPREVFADRDWSPVNRAHYMIYRAELAGVYESPDELDLWRLTAEVDDENFGEYWIRTFALMRWANSLVTHGGDRAETAAVLRRVVGRADRCGFHALRHEAEAVAKAARISLEKPALPAQPTATTHPWERLTAREQEVLGCLSVGQSNAEIAAALFISPKTVSVHVTNVLRKTGTSSRAKAVAWGRRQGLVPPD